MENNEAIKSAFDKLFGEFYLTTSDVAYRLFKAGWLSSKDATILSDEEINVLLKRVTIEAREDMLYVTEPGMRVFARQIEDLIRSKT